MVVPASAHRIFKTEWLHQLQVRYPWAGGYGAAPLAFHVASTSNLLLLCRVAPPLFAGVHTAGAAQAHGAAAFGAFAFHFLRRLLEVLFINDYTGTFERDSRAELVYYSVWGLVAGAAVSPASLARFGVPARPLRLLGLALFAVGQLGNAWCHWELRRLRAEANQLGASHYVIPSRGPFAYVSCPHYTFELLTWVGYALHSGLDGTSLLLLALSTVAMAPFASARHVKCARTGPLPHGLWACSRAGPPCASLVPGRYLRIFRDGQRAAGDPSRRWKMVPFVW